MVQQGELMQRIARQRKAFEKDLLTALGPTLEGTSWKKSGSILFNASQGIFQEIDISVLFNDEKIRVAQRIKPMTLDPILWDILGLSENASKTLSFRSSGAFTCPGLPIYEDLLDASSGRVTDAVLALSTLARDNERLFVGVLAATAFSTLVAQHPNQRERGAYAVTLVTSLINDGEREAAARLASAYESGELSSCMNLSSNGISFHRLALDWIESGAYLERFTL